MQRPYAIGLGLLGTLLLLGVVVKRGPRETLIPAGAAPAANCNLGELFLDTDEINDANCITTLDNAICACVAANTWADTKGL